ncbi:MAG: agmatine deiminase family protein [Anaerolineae bacterium]|nr:agmatine deiminase family protein [Anaerolineae bacterium]
MSRFPLQFQTVPYPLWRRRMPGWLRRASLPLLERWTAASADLHPPQTPEATTAYLLRWRLIDPTEQDSALRALADTRGIEAAAPFNEPPLADPGTIRLPSQWEPIETVLLSWPAFYPALWPLHTAMTAAIAPVAPVTILVPSALWGASVRWFLQRSGTVDLDRVRFMALPTDDIWVRDYGPVIGRDAQGQRVCLKFIYAPLPSYPQDHDDTMALRWAAQVGIPTRRLDLHLEGGNIWSDGQGTVIVSEHAFHANPGLTVERLRVTLGADKLIVTPRLEREETGHVDLLVKLADARTVLLSRATGWLNGDNLRRARRVFETQTNAAGELYRIFDLPTPPLYLNWLCYPVWRSYTNALTVNGRVLVPVYGLREDAEALAVYRAAMPDYMVIPMDCSASVNDGGAVHCLTKEIPRA